MNPCCDYAHCYLGCDFTFTWPDGDWVEGRVELVNSTGFMCGKVYKSNVPWADNWYEINDFRESGDFKLRLRHPCDMTQKQKKIYKSLCYQVMGASGDKPTILRIVDTPQSLKFMFDNGIDAFDLIESGYAIDIKPESPKHSITKEKCK